MIGYYTFNTYYMMKNYFIAIIMFIIPLTTMADGFGESIIFQVSYDDKSPLNPFPKLPVSPPSVSYDDHTLYFETPCDGCTLNIVDSNNVVVYTTVIPTGTTSLVLPATLSGEYELQIIRAGYLFYGMIDLP